MNVTSSRTNKQHASFIRKQYEFAANIRDAERNPAPADVEDRRMAIYRELFFNNVEDFMANCYPVVKEIMGEDRWLVMMQDYFARHRASTPLFPAMPSELLTYLEHERQPLKPDPPFLLELAHYEWIELALSQSDEAVDTTVIDTNASLLSGVPIVSPLAMVLSYWYPVHRISESFQPDKPGKTPTYLVVYRDRLDDVHFMEINAVTFRLLQLVSDSNQPITGQKALETVSGELNHPQPEVVIERGIRALEELKQRGVILGTQLD